MEYSIPSNIDMDKIFKIIILAIILGLFMRGSTVDSNEDIENNFKLGYQVMKDVVVKTEIDEPIVDVDFKEIKKNFKYERNPFKPWNTGGGDTEGEIYVPLFLQTDERWSDIKVGNTNLADGGCGIVSLCMVSSAYGNVQVPSKDIADKFEKYYINGVGLSWNSMTEGAKDVFGLESHYIGVPSDTDLKKVLYDNIAIVSFKPGKFTSSGHFAVLTLDVDGTSINVYDPNDSSKKLFKFKDWDSKFILNEVKGVWIYSDIVI